MRLGRYDTGVAHEDLGVLRIWMFCKLLRHYFPQPRRLADLGAGPCAFARWAVKLGHQVTAIDARTDRKPADEDMDGIDFLQADIRDVELAPYDLIAALGVYYHLEAADQLRLLRRCRPIAPIVFDTQLGCPDLLQSDAAGAGWAHAFAEFGPYAGYLYAERDTVQASVGNSHSFFPTPETVTAMAAEAGYSELIEVDPLFHTHIGPRRFYVCL